MIVTLFLKGCTSLLEELLKPDDMSRVEWSVLIRGGWFDVDVGEASCCLALPCGRARLKVSYVAAHQGSWGDLEPG
jgi:hypothetical protein